MRASALMTEPEGAAKPRRADRRAAAFVATATAVLAIRLALDARRYAVNVLYWDQWDFWNPLFRGAGAWEVFRWEHTPHRQGVGGLLIAAVARASGWDVRAETAVAIALVTLAAVTALLIARRLRGHWVARDAVIPLLVLTFSQWELFAGTPNLAHGPVPLLLIMLFALGAGEARSRVRLAILVIAGVACIETGFGVLLAAVAIPLLAAALWGAVRDRRDVVIHAAALAACGGAVALYFHGYVFAAAVECFRFPDPHPLRYLEFVSRYFLRPFELQALTRIAPTAGAVAGLALTVACAGLAAWGAIGTAATAGRSRLHATVFVLAGFSLTFAANAAVGRVCLGPEAADASRYIPYQLPWLLALYLALERLPARSLRVGGLAALVALAVFKETPRRQRLNHDLAAWFANGKRAWAECYRATGDVPRCQKPFPIYPEPRYTDMDAKLAFLRERRLNLFKP
ncbi:MAG TPA: hypothetical protein VM753_04850 [Anaeromyxobacter sp.]|jgi:hypothetical protein|nr:hypothetical protein [Anaeromyxobacter sp.]